MCFSATASFTAGAALSAVGAVTVRRARGKAELPLAAIPLLFGVQQISEGFLWVSLRHGMPNLASWSMYIFTAFSHVIWPILIPFAILLVETKRWRKSALRIFLGLGLAVGFYLLYFLITLPMTAQIYHNSIFYDTRHFYIYGVLALYLLATCVSGLFSRHWCINVFGVLAFVLAVIAYEVSVKTFVSVWCFYAAVLSLLVLVHFTGPMQAHRPALARSRERAQK